MSLCSSDATLDFSEEKIEGLIFQMLTVKFRNLRQSLGVPMGKHFPLLGGLLLTRIPSLGRCPQILENKDETSPFRYLGLLEDGSHLAQKQITAVPKDSDQPGRFRLYDSGIGNGPRASKPCGAAI